MEILTFLKRRGISPLWLVLAVGALVGVLLSLEIYLALRPEGRALDAPRFLVARRDLAVNSVVRLADLTVISDADGLKEAGDELLTDQDLDELSGAILKESIPAGTRLTRTMLRPVTTWRQRIPKGSLAYRLVPSNQLPVEVGDHIEIMVSPPNPDSESLTLVSGAIILKKAESDGGIIVAVTRQDIDVLEKSRNAGGLSIALQNPSDSPYRWEQKRKRRGKAQSFQVEILSEEH